MSRTLALREPQPSQLFIDANRFRRAIEWFDFDEPTYEPISVISLNEEVVISDGHTRALLAYLSGVDRLHVVQDPDRQELNIELYRECVGWCYNASIRAIPDLIGRIVSRETFLKDWVARCHASPHSESDETEQTTVGDVSEHSDGSLTDGYSEIEPT